MPLVLQMYFDDLHTRHLNAQQPCLLVAKLALVSATTCQAVSSPQFYEVIFMIISLLY